MMFFCILHLNRFSMNKVTAKILNPPGYTLKIVAYVILGFSVIYLFYIFHHKSLRVDVMFLATRFVNPLWAGAGIVLGGLNWVLRIKKWQFLASGLQKTSFKDAAFQQLSTFSWSFFTPFNSGEFVQKPLFFDNKKAALKLVAYEQGSQMIITLWLGITALTIYFEFPVYIPVLLLITAAAVCIFLRKKFRNILLLSLLRYFVFGGFLLILLILSSDRTPDIFLLGSQIALYYAAVSFIPLIPGLDLPVKTSVAYLFFSGLFPAENSLLLIMLWLWIWNTFFPALAGQLWFYLRLRKIF